MTAPIVSTRAIAKMLASAVFVWALMATQGASAGGLYVAEAATADMGTAGAGALARAGDAATALFNPAAMTYLDDHQAQAGLALLFSRGCRHGEALLFGEHGRRETHGRRASADQQDLISLDTK